MKHLKRAARKHATPATQVGEQGGYHADKEQSFIAGAKWQAKQDAETATDEAQNHSKGGFFQLGTNIAKRILQSVGGGE